MSSSPPSPATALRRLYPEDLPGFWRKRLEVPSGQRAVVWQSGQPKVLGGGSHNLGRPFPEVILLFPNDTFALHPSVTGLRSQDDEEWVADFVVTLRAPRPERLVELAENPQPPGRVLQQRAQLEVYPHLWQLANNRSSAELAAPETASDLVVPVRQVLTNVLDPLGLRVEGVPTISFRPAAEVPPMPEEEAPDTEPEGAPVEEPTPDEIVESSDASRTATLVDTAMRSLGYREEAPPRESNRMVLTLRVLGSILIGGTAMLNIFWPGSDADISVRIVASLASLILAVAAILSSLWAARQVKAQSRQSLRQAPLRPDRRQELNRLATTQMNGALEQARQHLEEAWNRAFRTGQHDLATAVRQVAKAMEPVGDDLVTSGPAQASLLTRPDPPLALLEAWVYLDRELFFQLEEIAGLSRQLFDNVIENHWEQVKASSKEIEKALQQVRGQIVQRSALLSA